MRSPFDSLTRSFVTKYWVFQASTFLFGALLFGMAPRFTLTLLVAHTWRDFVGPHHTVLPQLAVDQVRVIGAFLIAPAYASSLGVLRTEDSFRKGLAWAMALFITLWAVVFSYNLSSGRYGPLGVLMFGVPGAVSAVANWWFVYKIRDSAKVRWDFGSSDGRPPMLWVVWMLQTIVFAVWGMARMFYPARCLVLLVGQARAEAMPAEAWVLATDQVRMVGPYTVCVAILSFLGLIQEKVAVWQAFRRLFIGVLTGWTVVLVLNAVTESYQTSLMLAAAIPTGLMLAINLFYAPHTDPGLGVPSEGTWNDWLAIDLVAGPMMALQSVMQRGRASHLVGVGASGSFQIDPRSQAPAHSFFAAGQRFVVTARFANLSLSDDAGLDVRGAALRFRLDAPNAPAGSGFDLVMNTGSFCPAGDLVEFGAFVASKFLPEWGSEMVVSRDARKLEGAVAGLRRAPESYASLRYHSQRISYWIDAAGARHLVRYRLVPASGAPESGLPDPDDCDHVWQRARRDDEHRATDYLRQELPKRLGDGPVLMRLEAQFHRPFPAEPLAWYDASLDWDPVEHPWLALGTVTLTNALAAADTELLRFNPAHAPQSLSVPRGQGLRDPRSLADSEVRVMHRLQDLRMDLMARGSEEEEQ